MEKLYNAYLQAAMCLVLSIFSLSASQSVSRRICANALLDDQNEIRYCVQVFLVDELNNPLFAYRQGEEEEYHQPLFRHEKPGSSPLVDSWKDLEVVPVADEEVLDEELDLQLCKDIVVKDGRAQRVDHDKVKILLKKLPRMCRMPKMHCMNPQKHRDHKVYFCLRCDEQCPLCVERCESCQEKVSYCWDHPDRATYCKACDGQCPQSHVKEVSQANFECSSCHESKHVSEKVTIDSCHCEQDNQCSSCIGKLLRSEDVTCKTCSEPLTARFECLICYENKAGNKRVLFSSCECNIAICTDCTVDMVNHRRGCPTCRNAITYQKCDGCRGYLGEKERAISYSCAQQTVMGRSYTLHRFHPECFELHPYKSKSGNVVTRCPLLHKESDAWVEDFEVKLSKINGLEVDLEVLEIADQPGWLTNNCCNLCHKGIERNQGVEHRCHGKSHRYHTNCIHDFIEKHAVKIKGRAGFYCPVSHGYEPYCNKSNARRFCTILDRLDQPMTPNRLKTCCPLCKQRIEDELSPLVTSEDCVRRNFWPWDGVRSQRYLIHVRCFTDHLRQQWRETSEGWLRWEKVVSYPCPYHKDTNESHMVTMPLVEARRLRALFEEK